MYKSITIAWKACDKKAAIYMEEYVKDIMLMGNMVKKAVGANQTIGITIHESCDLKNLTDLGNTFSHLNDYQSHVKEGSE